MVAPSGECARIPAPAGISAQAKAWLANDSFDTELNEPTDPSDLEGWLAFVAERDRVVYEVLAANIPTDLPVERKDTTIGGVSTFVLRPHHVADSADSGVYLDIHGGGLILGGGELCALMATAGALGRDMITWSPDYRMAPRHPYPAALDDVLAVYRAALAAVGSERIIVGGSSAGGNLAAALLLRAKDEGLPMPAALVLLTPEVDLTESGDSFVTNRVADSVLGSLMTTNLLYANGHDLSHPYLSPLFGDVTGFPPTHLQAGTRDLFLSNTVRMHRKLRAAGVPAELHVGEAMPHGGFGGRAPEDLELAAEVRRFVAEHRHRG